MLYEKLAGCVYQLGEKGRQGRSQEFLFGGAKLQH